MKQCNQKIDGLKMSTIISSQQIKSKKRRRSDEEEEGNMQNWLLEDIEGFMDQD